eukprot:comp30361_c0_seq1/m.47235 comp30361_c0_seq1/g.47235  ORF comp30361_c0_seq1/g.47235 comp30361_c0_seq1/m.47235 type:complete len:143 (-) comp30361_c0_seq1:202-630(-)
MFDVGSLLDKIGHVGLAYLLTAQVALLLAMLVGPGEAVARWVRSQPADSAVYRIVVPAMLGAGLLLVFVAGICYQEALSAKAHVVETGDRKVTPYTTYFRSQRDLYMVGWASINVFVLIGIVSLRTRLQQAQNAENSNSKDE